MALHEHRVQDPVEILTRADARALDGCKGVQHCARADRDPGNAQRAGEVNEIVGELAALLAASFRGPQLRADLARSAPSPCRPRGAQCRPDI